MIDLPFFFTIETLFFTQWKRLKTCLKPFKQFFFTVKTPLIHLVFTVGIQLMHVFYIVETPL